MCLRPKLDFVISGLWGNMDSLLLRAIREENVWDLMKVQCSSAPSGYFLVAE